MCGGGGGCQGGGSSCVGSGCREVAEAEGSSRGGGGRLLALRADITIQYTQQHAASHTTSGGRSATPPTPGTGGLTGGQSVYGTECVTVCRRRTGGGQEEDRRRGRDLYQGDGALSTKPVMHYQGTAYLCYQGACQSTQGVSYGHRLQCHLSAGIGAAQISIT